MKKQILALIVAVLCGMPIFAQVTTGEGALKAKPILDKDGWSKGAKISINFSQASFNNWIAGGQNSLAINGLLSANLNYKKALLHWENTLTAGYGTIKQGKLDFFKSDDRVEINTKLGYQLSEKIHTAALLNFKTQSTPGYVSPTDLTLTSDLFAPAYVIGALGLDIRPLKNLTLFAAPATFKTTLVFNQVLSDAGAFGVKAGESIRNEFGGYIRSAYKVDLVTNVSLETKLDLFSNYLKDPQFIDVNWEMLILMKINKFLTASLGTHLVYDHDILIGADTTGDGVDDDFSPRVQFKELLGVGLTFTF